MNKILGSLVLIAACCVQANAATGRTDASAPASTSTSSTRNANDAFCSAGTPCEVNRHRAGEYH